MGRAPCCAKIGLHRGQWTPKEDALLVNYIQTHGDGNWKTLPKKAGLLRCGKSCRLRWMNYLRPGVKRGNITPDEEELIVRMHSLLGNRWSLIAGRLPGRTDNEIKNYWNTHISKRLRRQGFDPNSHKKLPSKEGLNKKSKESKDGTAAKVYLPKAVRVRGTALPLSEYISQQRDSDLFNGLEDGELRLLMDTFGGSGGEDVRLLGEAFREEEVGEYSGVPWCDLKRSITADEGDLVNGSESEFEMGVANIIDKSLEHVYQEYMQLLNNNIEDQD